MTAQDRLIERDASQRTLDDTAAAMYRDVLEKLKDKSDYATKLMPLDEAVPVFVIEQILAAYFGQGDTGGKE